MQENISQVGYRADTETPQQQFKDHFQDFYVMQPWTALFTDPLSATVSEQPPQLQLELCTLQSDPFFQAKCKERGILLWRLLPKSRFPLLRDFALSMASMFGSTYESKREQLLNNEAHQVKREKEADGWNSLPAHADWMHKHWQWHSVYCKPAGKATSISLKEHYRKYSSNSIKENWNMQKIGRGEP